MKSFSAPSGQAVSELIQILDLVSDKEKVKKMLSEIGEAIAEFHELSASNSVVAAEINAKEQMYKGKDEQIQRELLAIEEKRSELSSLQNELIEKEASLELAKAKMESEHEAMVADVKRREDDVASEVEKASRMAEEAARLKVSSIKIIEEYQEKLTKLKSLME